MLEAKCTVADWWAVRAIFGPPRTSGFYLRTFLHETDTVPALTTTHAPCTRSSKAAAGTKDDTTPPLSSPATVVSCVCVLVGWLVTLVTVFYHPTPPRPPPLRDMKATSSSATTPNRTYVICPFGNVEVLEERYHNNAIKEFWDTTLQVDQDGFFVADGKWKVSWKKITHLKMNHDVIEISTVRGDPHTDDHDNYHDNERDEPHNHHKNKKKGLQVQARLASNTRVPPEWSSFQHYVTKKWTKLQEKKHRLQEALQQQAEEEAREARRAAAKPKRSRVERFFMKNLANIKTFEDESDDETFNRRNHKVLMAERKEKAEQLPESENSNHHDDDVSQGTEEQEEQEAILHDPIPDAEPPLARKDKASSAQQHKARRLKRKSHNEDEDSDDENLFGTGPSVTEVSKRAVVTPGATTMKKAAILDDDDEDMEAEESNADISNVPPITSYFKPKVPPGTTTATKKPAFPVKAAAKAGSTSIEVTTTTKPEEPTTTPFVVTKKIAKNAAPVNFFAPRVTKAAVTKVKKAEESDEETVVATPPHEAPRTPPRSSYKHLYQQSASKMEQDEDHIMDFVDERHVSPMRPTKAAPINDRITPETQRRQRNFFGTKAPPSRNFAVMALDQADKSPVQRNLYEGLDTVSPSRRSSTSALSSPPRKRMTFASPQSPSLTKAISPSAVPALSSKFPGLRNLGNTCYINSSLQMLFSIPDFVHDLKPFSSGRRLVDSFCDTFQNVIHPAEGAVGSVSAKKLKVAVDSTTDKFRGYQQRDAHEFLGHLIDEIHEEIEPKKQSEDEVPSSSQEASCTEEMLPTDDYFRLNVEVCLKCKSCGYSR